MKCILTDGMPFGAKLEKGELLSIATVSTRNKVKRLRYVKDIEFCFLS